MKHAATATVGWIVAAGLGAGCGSLAVNGTGSPSRDISGPDASLRCGGVGEACCNQTACDTGLTCSVGTCSGSGLGQGDATRPAPDDDSSADARVDAPMDSAASPDVGNEGIGDAAGEGGAPDAEGFDAADGQVEAGPPVCIASAAACMTGNPGACGPGASACDDGGAAVCRPLQTTQPCYTGPAGTQGVGSCEGGRQSCVGALGACTGQVLPAAHDDCFTATDDDCDGTAGDGCPQALTLGPDRPLAGVGGTGGTATTVHCPKGAFVTRVDSWFDDTDQRASGVSIDCARPALVRGASSYSVALTAVTPAPYQKAAGTGATDERTDDCGTSGFAAITYATGLADTAIDGLGNHCGAGTVTLASDNTLTVSFLPSGDQSYNAWSNSPGTFFDQACRSSEAIVGYTLRIGTWLDNIQPICAPLQVTYP
jgi:hypothetical protein